MDGRYQTIQNVRCMRNDEGNQTEHGVKMTAIMFKLIFLYLAISFLLVPPIAFGASHEYIVVYHDGINLVSKLTASNMYGVTVVDDYSEVTIINAMLVKASPGRIAQLEADPTVKYIQRNDEIHIFEQTIPTGITMIKVQGIGSGVSYSNITIGIMDTGLWKDHPDLNVVGGINFHSGLGGNPLDWDDTHGHGTHVGGIIGAIDNDIGVVGVVPDAQLFAVRILNEAGSGSTSDMIKGLDWLTNNFDIHGAIVWNHSYGAVGTSDFNCGQTDGRADHEAFCRSTELGFVHVVAAGNRNRDAMTTVPAAYADAVITVSCVNPLTRVFCTFSNSGKVVDITSPGRDIDSTVPLTGASCCSDPSGYKALSGTSMSAPHVTGVAAIWVDKNPQLPDTRDRFLFVRIAMIETGTLDWEGDPDTDQESLVNADINFQRDPNAPLPSEPPSPTNNPPVAREDRYRINIGSVVQLNVLVNDSDPDGDPLTIQSVDEPSWGMVTIMDDQIKYTHTNSLFDRDRFTYTISDGRGGISTALIIIDFDRPSPDDPTPPQPEDPLTSIKAKLAEIDQLQKDIDIKLTEIDQLTNLINQKIDEIVTLLDELILDDGSKEILDAIRELLVA